MFQLLFGRNKNKDLTDNFIKSILKHENESIELNNINIYSEVSLEKLAIKDKHVRLDVIAQYDEATVCIEMQNKKNSNIYQRARCYAAKINATQLQAGQDYLELKPLIMISILNYAPSNLDSNEYIEHIVTVNKRHCETEVKMGIKFIFVFLKKLSNKDIFNHENNFLHWLKFIEYKDLEVIDMINTMNVHTKKATDELNRINAEREERRIAEIIENGELDARLEYSAGVDAGRIEGEATGLVKGRAEGIVEGEARGLIKGKLEAFIELAKQMLDKKYSIEEIISLTGLSKKEICKLAKNEL